MLFFVLSRGVYDKAEIIIDESSVAIAFVVAKDNRLTTHGTLRIHFTVPKPMAKF